MSNCEDQKFLIFSRSMVQGIIFWWKPDARGYTNNIDWAGRFSREEANVIVGHRGSEEIIVVPENSLTQLISRRIVDMGDGENWSIIYGDLASIYGG